jgi:hypothetical protein
MVAHQPLLSVNDIAIFFLRGNHVPSPIDAIYRYYELYIFNFKAVAKDNMVA